MEDLPMSQHDLLLLLVGFAIGFGGYAFAVWLYDLAQRRRQQHPRDDRFEKFLSKYPDAIRRPGGITYVDANGDPTAPFEPWGKDFME